MEEEQYIKDQNVRELEVNCDETCLLVFCLGMAVATVFGILTLLALAF